MVARLAVLAALLALLSVVTALKAVPSTFKAAFCPAVQTPSQGPALRATKTSSRQPEGATTSAHQRAHQQRRMEHEWREKFVKGKLMRSVDSMEVPSQSRHKLLPAANLYGSCSSSNGTMVDYKATDSLLFLHCGPLSRHVSRSALAGPFSKGAEHQASRGFTNQERVHKVSPVQTGGAT